MTPKSTDPTSIFDQFVSYAKKEPNATALVDSGNKVSYGQLLNLSLALAHVLIERQSVETPVAILGHRTFETPLAILACSIAGRPFVVLDSAYPRERIRTLLELSGADTVLYSTEIMRFEADSQDDQPHIANWIQIGHPWPERSDFPKRHPSETAYLLFTSGTTGFPKGIRTGHKPLPHFVKWYTRTFDVRPGCRFSMLSGLSHDPLLRDIFVPLSTGGELHIPAQPYLLDPDLLYAWMRDSRIQYAHITPQLIGILAAGKRDQDSLSNLQYVFSGGDVLRPVTVEQAEEISPEARLVNFYGTSETPQAMAYQVIGPEMKPPYPLGSPISDVQIHILDENHEPVAPGVDGEIAIDTEYLSNGYLVTDTTDGAASIQRATFLPSLTEGNTSSKMYLTGDVGFAQDELIHFVGRRDDQVKIRGYRVDCAEVAATIERLGLAKDVVVLPGHRSNGEIFLIAFVTGEHVDLRQALQAELPGYMVPGHFVNVDKMPFLANGKINREALLKLGEEHIAKQSATLTGLEDDLISKIANVLAGITVDPQKSFVELGGDSLSFIELSLVIEKHLGRLPDNWENIPLGDLAAMKDYEQTHPNRLRSKNRFFSVNLSVFFRAFGILMVVMDHAGYPIGIGTSTLFVIAGISFGRFMLPNIIQTGRIEPVFRYVLKFAIPASLWLLLAELKRHHVWLPDIFLMGTFWQDPAGGHFNFWFLDVLWANILLLSLFAIVSRAIRRSRPKFITEWPDLFWESFTLTVIGILIFFAQIYSGWWDGSLGSTSVAPFKWLWMLAFGSSITLATTTSQKAVLSCLLVVLGWLYFGQIVALPHFRGLFGHIFFVSVGALIWFKNISIPKYLRGIVVKTASSSLFIYIVNYTVIHTLMPKLHIPPIISIRVVLAILAGIVAAYLWEHFVRIVFLILNRYPRHIVDEV